MQHLGVNCGGIKRFERGDFDPKFQIEGIATHQPFFFSEN